MGSDAELAKFYYDACVGMDADLEDLICPALDIENDPEYGWVIGDHTGHTLAMTLVSEFEKLKSKVKELEGTVYGLEMQLSAVKDNEERLMVELAKQFSDE